MRTNRLRRLAGFNLISATATTMILSIIALGTISAVTTAIQLDSLSRERNLALRAVEVQYEAMLILNRNEFLLRYDPVNVGTTAETFDIGGLDHQKIVDPSTGEQTELPNGITFVTAPQGIAGGIGGTGTLNGSGLLPFNEASMYTVYIEVRWNNKFLGDFTKKFSLILNPPDSF